MLVVPPAVTLVEAGAGGRTTGASTVADDPPRSAGPRVVDVRRAPLPAEVVLDGSGLSQRYSLRRIVAIGAHWGPAEGSYSVPLRILPLVAGPTSAVVAAPIAPVLGTHSGPLVVVADEDDPAVVVVALGSGPAPGLGVSLELSLAPVPEPELVLELGF